MTTPIAADLAEQQRRFADAVRLQADPQDVLAAPVEPGLSVYRHAYSARLLAALNDNYTVLARAMGDPFETARAWRGLGDCAARGDNDAEAIRCWGKALAAYGKLGNPQADRLAGRISELRRAR